MIGFMFRNLKGYRFLVVVAVAMTFAQVGSDILLALPILWISNKIQFSLNPVNTVKNPNPPAFLDPLISPFNRFASPHDQAIALAHGVPTTIGVIFFSVAALLILSIVSALLAYIGLYLASFIAQNLTARLRRQLFEHLQRLSLDWHGKQKKGDLVQRVTGDISNIEKLVTDGLVDLIAATLTVVGVVTVMLIVNWQFTLISTVIVPALALIVLGYTTSIKAASKKAAKAAGQVANVAAEDIGAITVLKAFTLEEREAVRFNKYVGKNREAGLRAGGLQAQFTPLVGILLAIGTAIILGVGAYVAAGNLFSLWFLTIPAFSITIGTLFIFLGYLKMLYQPFRDLSKLTNLYTSATAGADRIQEVMDAAPEVAESKTPYHGPTKLKGDISFEHVIFGYTPNRPILKGINLHIPAGRKVALVGLSGGGKTTLVKLISRLYEIQQGAVRIDGVDNRMYPLPILRQNVSMVLQDNVLFEGTIRENIEIGKPGASFEEVIDAAKKAHMHDTIMSLPDKYDTEVREQGKNFSGGQRQRLAIARAILRDSPILILDEPTAALDVEAEAEVMHALDKLVVGRSVLMISHRLSTLGNVDEIIVLKDGRIVEQGTFKELKRRGGVFAGLLEEQNRYNQDRAGDQSIIRSAFMPAPAAAGQYQVPPPPAPAQYRPGMPAQPPAAQQWPGMSPSPVPIPPVRGNGGQAGRGEVYVDADRQPAAFNQKARVLIELDGKIVGERKLDKPLLTVGRLSGNDVQVPSQRVSRLHAKIRWENSTWVIEDAESLNGLVIRGQLVERHILSNGDRIHVAPTAVIRYELIP
jgi:ABC-type multidrug transport system fused ATPase/permease subunit